MLCLLTSPLELSCHAGLVKVGIEAPERERERDRNRQEERKSEESNKTDITPALQRNTEAKKALLCG